MRFTQAVIEAIQNMPHPAPLNLTGYSDGFIDGKHHAIAAVRSLDEPRPEPVVKAEALRDAADFFAAGYSATEAQKTMIMLLRRRADSLDPPALDRPKEPTGDRAVVRDRDGDVWVREDERIGLPWKAVRSGALSTWSRIADAYGPLTVLSNGVGEPS